jgi:hypothetical protein
MDLGSGKLIISKGYFGLGKFISLDLLQQEDLMRVADLAHNYTKRDRPIRPLNIYIEASPGSGKSFFVNQVINALKGASSGKEYVTKTFNLSNMLSIKELGDAFRIVQSINIDRKMPVIFFDEVDSKIENIYDSYPAFLAPMFDGKIYNQGNEYTLGAGIFFFAASKKLTEMITINSKAESKKTKNETRTRKKAVRPLKYEAWIKNEREQYCYVIDNWQLKENKQESPKKLKDFLDRIDATVFLPPANILPNGQKADLKSQQLLITGNFILKHFPYIRFIEAKALTILANSIANQDSFRVLDSLVFRSTPPIDKHYRIFNIPIEYLNSQKMKIERIVQDDSVPNILIKILE